MIRLPEQQGDRKASFNREGEETIVTPSSHSMEPTITIRYRLTEAEFRQAHRYHVSHTWCRPVFRLILHSGFALLIFNGCVLLFRGNQIATGISEIIAGISWFAILPAERRRAADWMAHKQFAQIADQDIKIEWLVSPTKLVNRSGLGHGDYVWQTFTKAVRTPAGLMLYQTDQIYHWLPQHAFAGYADYEQVVELAKNKVHKFYNVG